MDKHKLGIIVPYRDREKHLEQFKKRMNRYLKNLDIPYEIIIVHQDNAKLFNRGMLLNIGFKYAEKLKCDYVVFHDVDMLPLHVDYSYSDVPLHLATNFSEIKNVKPKETFDEYFGGVTLFPMDLFKKINGYSNKYWGWGYEDTDLLLRCVKKNVPLDSIKLNNSRPKGKCLKFNGVDAFIKGKNNIDLNKPQTIYISFYPDEIIFDHTKDVDNYNIFTIPGYDTAISYNSFLRYNFCTFNQKHEALYVNSKIKTNYKTNMCVTIDSGKINVYQDGLLIGEIENSEKLLKYKNEKFFYLGVSKPDSDDPKFFKGYIDEFAIIPEVLSEKDVLKLSQNSEYFLNKVCDSLSLYYDTNFIEDYKLTDLSGNNNHGEIKKCEIVDLDIEKYKVVKIPYRRDSTVYLLDHEENGFLNNRWKTDETRWNQLRFHNEVSKNDELLENDGLSDLQYIEHGKEVVDNITHINIGI
jgi:hypothetical protein